MRNFNVFVLIVLIFIFPVILNAEFTGTTGIIDIPTAILSKPGVLTVSLVGGMGIKDVDPSDISYASTNLPGYHKFDIDLVVKYSFNAPLPMELSFSAYTLDQYVLDWVMSIPSPVPLAIGISNMTYKKNVSPVEGGYIDEALYASNRSSEWFSFFVVTSKDLGSLGKYTLGFGRGKFIGLGPKSKYFNISYYYPMSSDLAMGAFFGGELPVVKDKVYLLGDFDGRDVNVGAKVQLKNFQMKVAVSHAEQFLPGYPASPMLDAAFSYDIDLGELNKKGTISIVCYDVDTRKRINARLNIISPKSATYNMVNGYKTLELPIGEYQIEIKAKDYASVKKVINVKEGKKVYKIPLKKIAITKYSANTPQAKYYRTALLYYKRGDVMNALANINKALKLDPNNKTYKTFRQKIYKKRDEQVLYHKKMARSYTAKGKLTSAKREWNIVLKLKPTDKEAKLALKKLASKKRVTKKTTQKSKKKITKKKKTAVQWYNEGLAYYKKGNYKSAIKCFNEALKLDPKNKKAKRYLRKAKNRLKAGG